MKQKEIDCLIEKERLENVKIVRKCDWILGITLFIMIIDRMVSLAYFRSIVVDTKAELETVVTAYEVNPVFKALVNLTRMSNLLKVILMPAMAIATYWFFRSRVLQGKLNAEYLQFFVNFAFLVILLNIVESTALLAGKIL